MAISKRHSRNSHWGNKILDMRFSLIKCPKVFKSASVYRKLFHVISTQGSEKLHIFTEGVNYLQKKSRTFLTNPVIVWQSQPTAQMIIPLQSYNNQSLLLDGVGSKAKLLFLF